jgi:hypothetical protein
MHVITPSDLLKFQIEHYSEMLEKPCFEGQERFLNNEINKLYGKHNSNNIITVRYRLLDMDNKNFYSCMQRNKGIREEN